MQRISCAINTVLGIPRSKELIWSNLCCKILHAMMKLTLSEEHDVPLFAHKSGPWPEQTRLKPAFSGKLCSKSIFYSMFWRPGNVRSFCNFHKFFDYSSITKFSVEKPVHLSGFQLYLFVDVSSIILQNWTSSKWLSQ